MTGYIDVCAARDIPNGRHRAFQVKGRSVLVIRLNADFYAIANRCTHLDFPLEGGRQMGCEIICRQHGARFDMRDGHAIGAPAVDPVRTFALRLSGDRIEIRLDERSEEHTSELQSLMRNSYAVFCLKKKNKRRSIAIKTNTHRKT